MKSHLTGGRPDLPWGGRLIAVSRQGVWISSTV